MFCLRNGIGIITLFFTLLMPGLSIGAEEKEDSGIGLEAGLTFESRYIWRGFDFNHGDPVFEPWLYYEPPYVEGLTIQLYSVVGVGTNSAVGDKSNGVDEVDFELAYAHPIFSDRLTGTVGLVVFGNISDHASDNGSNRVDSDLTAKFSYKFSSIFSTYAAYARGLDHGIRGNYGEAGANATLEIVPSRIRFEPAVVTGFYSSQFGAGGKFAYVMLNVPVTFRIGRVTVIPHYAYFYVPHPAPFDDTGRNFGVAGVELGCRF